MGTPSLPFPAELTFPPHSEMAREEGQQGQKQSGFMLFNFINPENQGGLETRPYKTLLGKVFSPLQLDWRGAGGEVSFLLA